ncbi:sorting nexin-11 [Trichomycterus rosablanca]|uniref:sorting nexin-11 n=1 Tax=Trichomycterus rosablanca TaxID=2290929 RepID=UPI002F3602A6
MIKSQEDEFIAVRVQDPRMVNEGSWNSYVDFKIFLHTNSKAFTAKTSCVRRRYSEFVWLKRTLQKNAGLVPVPELPGKSFFTFNNTDFIEKRRMGLQHFLDKVVHMTVCLSDSQLHLFLQTQLPLGHIEDCIKGHTPYSVTDAILTYASSNRGWAQEEEGGGLESCPTPISYESVESPLPDVSISQYEKPPLEPVTTAAEINCVVLRLHQEDAAVPNGAHGDDQEGTVEDGKSCQLVVELDQQVPIITTQNTKSDLSLPDERTQTHNSIEDIITYDSGESQPAADTSLPKAVATNNNFVTIF